MILREKRNLKSSAVSVRVVAFYDPKTGEGEVTVGGTLLLQGSKEGKDSERGNKRDEGISSQEGRRWARSVYGVGGESLLIL